MEQRHIERIRNPQFPVARHSYDKREVDNFMLELANWLESRAAEEVGSFAVKRKLEMVGRSTANILMAAENEAEELRRTTEEEMQQVRDILRIAQQPVSLEKPIGEEEESELGDFVEDQTAESPFELALESLRTENVRKALEALPEREREVIEMRFGLKGHAARTLEEVGRAFGVTRERIRQIENNTLKKLEHLPEAQALRDAVS